MDNQTDQTTLEQIEAAAKRAKFKTEFALLMLNCGRIDEANTAFTDSIEASDKAQKLAALLIIKTEVFG